MLFKWDLHLYHIPGILACYSNPPPPSFISPPPPWSVHSGRASQQGYHLKRLFSFYISFFFCRSWSWWDYRWLTFSSTPDGFMSLNIRASSSHPVVVGFLCFTSVCQQVNQPNKHMLYLSGDAVGVCLCKAAVFCVGIFFFFKFFCLYLFLRNVTLTEGLTAVISPWEMSC